MINISSIRSNYNRLALKGSDNIIYTLLKRFPKYINSIIEKENFKNVGKEKYLSYIESKIPVLDKPFNFFITTGKINNFHEFMKDETTLHKKLISDSEKILSRNFNIFNKNINFSSNEINWHSSLSDTEDWPLNYYSLLNYYSSSLKHGDPKYV